MVRLVCFNNCTDTSGMYRKLWIALLFATTLFCAGLLATFTLPYIANDGSITSLHTTLYISIPEGCSIALASLNKVQTAVSVVDALRGF
jgi:hypothetical protein